MGKRAKNSPKWEITITSCHAPNLRNCTSSEHNFLYTYVKWWYLQVSFSFFQDFDFFGLLGIEKGKRWSKMAKHSVHCTPYLRNHTSWQSFVVQMCKMVISPGVFFYVEILIFQVVKGLIGQKMAQNVENFYLLHFIFQEPYIIWSLFMVRMYV